MKEVRGYQGGYMWDDKISNSSGKTRGFEDWKGFGAEGNRDDFFLDDKYNGNGGGLDFEEEAYVPLVPSKDVICGDKIWITMRSEMNYKYLWMHATETMWLGASATMDTPIHRKAFITHAVDKNCQNGGWILLQEGDSDRFIMMVNPNRTTSAFSNEAWVVKLGTNDREEALKDPAYHFLIEKDGYLINRDVMACVNVIAEAEGLYIAKGHSNGWNRNKPAGREFGANLHFVIVNTTEVELDIAHELEEEKQAKEEDDVYIQQISRFPTPSNEKRVISFGLYGSKPKYTIGAVRNAELAKVYFPGWVCRFYVTSDVPKDILAQLTALGAEIRDIPSGMGYTSGMFWRFMVAGDPTVDRYIIRDTDSRLNARDRIAVEEWIQSKYPIHILRDHVNHCIVMNGGMWGGVKNGIPFPVNSGLSPTSNALEAMVLAWENKNEYMADLHFLHDILWPLIKDKQLAHDAYCCDRYPNTKPFPTQRSVNYQHVGQVFDEFDRPRLTDIDGFIRGVPTPASCRKRPEWIYG